MFPALRLKSWTWILVHAWRPLVAFQQRWVLFILWNSLFVLNFIYYVDNGVRLLNAKSNDFSSQGLDEFLHISSKFEDQVDNWLFLNVVISESSFILLLSPHESLSLVLNLMKRTSSPFEKSKMTLISFFI